MHSVGVFITCERITGKYVRFEDCHVIVQILRLVEEAESVFGQ